MNAQEHDHNTNPLHLAKLPGVDRMLAHPDVIALMKRHPREMIIHVIRQALEHFREQALRSIPLPDQAGIIGYARKLLAGITTKNLQRVINATGVIIHTHLGRAPFSPGFLQDICSVIEGYNNLEFDLETGHRGSRYTHVTGILKYLTGAGDILIVNNNAAAVMLILRSLARKKEVIISRGELIEIGGSFRMPDILKASECKMVEVGTTNKTHLRDYEHAITPGTALLLKAHRSNYTISGFTSEVGLRELVGLGREKGLPVLFDMGSGLLHRMDIDVLSSEPDVKEAVATGAALVCFSGDKLLGGPQAGIIAGKAELISRLKKEPMLRALRVGKLTLAALETSIGYYINEKELTAKNRVIRMLTSNPDDLRIRAGRLQEALLREGVDAEVTDSEGRCGGGSLPGKTIPSFAVRIVPSHPGVIKKRQFAGALQKALLESQTPVVGVIAGGGFSLNVLTISDGEIPLIVNAVTQSLKGLSS
ncbi:MAG: L-seryl-tRNA(Sec) selenium transferase [Bacteroidales bacterium]|nr:L-seryl-tRNA(Sec) selenium transferase [Bacteroidales bacterium]